jgi:hypothetical protein
VPVNRLIDGLDDLTRRKNSKSINSRDYARHCLRRVPSARLVNHAPYLFKALELAAMDGNRTPTAGRRRSG